jgi:hypothetical protein
MPDGWAWPAAGPVGEAPGEVRDGRVWVALPARGAAVFRLST